MRVSKNRMQGAARPWLIGVLVVAAIAVALGVWLLGARNPLGFSKGPQVALSDYHGADPTGVPASLRQASLVQQGAYLAKAADCLVCHTARGGAAFAGGFAFTLPFGTIYSTNITPDQETGIGNYSDAEFLNAMHGGIRRDGAHLYPAMPFASYTFMSDADALAIKAYLFSLPAVHAPARSNTLSFPFNQRWLLAMWSAAFNAGERFHPDGSQSPVWNRGAYLAEALEHCGECHTPRNPALALNERRKFGGALTAGWHAYNISSDAGTGIGSWSAEEVSAYLKQGHAGGHGTAVGPMGEAVDDSLSQLDASDLAALVTYVRSVPPVESQELPARLAALASPSHRDGPAGDGLGKRVFEGACVSCHGWSGTSPINGFATLTGARAVNDPTGTNVVQVVLAGADRTTPDGILRMPAFGSYSDSEVAAVANYVTARFGTTGSALRESDVASLRHQSEQ